MKEKPKMYHNKIDKVFHNNRLVYMSYDKDLRHDLAKLDDIRKKIDHILNDNSFIYRTMVNIKINNEIIVKKIIGIVNNNLITIDNERIPIESIQDIYK